MWKIPDFKTMDITTFLCCLVLCKVALALDYHESSKYETVDVTCEDGSLILCERPIDTAAPTAKTIEEEAKSKPSSRLYELFLEMINDADYDNVISTGRGLDLSKEETQAIRLFTMDTIGLFDELNAALREGENRYPVLHFWLQTAVPKLPLSTSDVYVGYKKKINANVNTVLRLPGFTAATEDLALAVGTSSPGCTIIRFDLGHQGRSVSYLSKFPEERAVIISPTEGYYIHEANSNDQYDFIYLRKGRLGSLSITVYTLCNTGNLVKSSAPLLFVIVTFQFMLPLNYCP